MSETVPAGSTSSPAALRMRRSRERRRQAKAIVSAAADLDYVPFEAEPATRVVVSDDGAGDPADALQRGCLCGCHAPHADPRHRACYPAARCGGLAAFLEDRMMPLQLSDHAGLSRKTAPEAEAPKTCLWCGRPFQARRDGGKRQVFRRPACRRDFDAAGRRWVAEAIATGAMTVDALRNGLAATRALVPAAISPTSECEAPLQHLARVSPPDFCYTRQRDLERLMAQAIATRRR